MLIVISSFALIAISLAAVGIFGVVSYSVHQRAQEIGIRMALGAQRRNVIGMVLGQGAVWLLLGISAGTAGAPALTRLLASYLYGVKPVDPVTFTAAAFTLIAVALAALPVPRAARRESIPRKPCAMSRSRPRDGTYKSKNGNRPELSVEPAESTRIPAFFFVVSTPS